jgi:uncharacterized protein involved in outer membrane biogenesis
MVSRGLRWILIPPAIVIALAVAVPFFVPVASFIPEISRIASEKLGQPVTIADLSLQFFPTPRMVATGIVIGKNNEARVEELEIVPELEALLSGARELRLIRAEKVELQESALAIPAGMPKSEGGEPLIVRRILLKQVRLHHSTLKLPELDIDAQLGPNLSLQEAKLEMPDGILNVKVTPLGERAATYALEGKIYGGTLKGTVKADWAKQWQVGGRTNIAGMDLVPVQRLLGKPPQISGRLKTDATFSARARTPDQLLNALAVDGPFEVLGGAYQGLDLSKAADLTGKAAAGDSTEFKELKGKMQVRGKRVRINELCVRSPSIVAGGYVEIAPDQKLSGRLDVSMAKTGGFVGVPVSLGGTTSDPSVSPTKGYLIGAVLGTVLLPGIGTSLGASAGSALEGKSGCK